MKFLKSKVSLSTFIITCIVVLIASISVSGIFKKKPTTEKPSVVNMESQPVKLRLKNYNLVEPLVLEDLNTESVSLIPIKAKIEKYIEEVKSEKKVENISVYVRQLNNSGWFCINPGLKYYPASMRKLLYMITYLKEAETNPQILEKKIYLKNHYPPSINKSLDEMIELKTDKYYSVKDLITFMIKYSNRDATLMLIANMNMCIYDQIFTDLGIPAPESTPEYFVTISDYSKIFRVLYNATYIRHEYSEYAMELLTQNTFSGGMKQGVDSTIEISHKMGNRMVEGKEQMHEFGIVFQNGDPYLLGVMTVGNSEADLSEIIRNISKITFESFRIKHPS